VTGGPPAYFATLPLAAILEALVADGVPAYVSNTAGTYLCNRTLYSTLHLVHTRGLRARVGFMHLPLLPSMVAQSGLDQPSMDLALMLRAVEVALSVIATPARSA
jgi:pyroglutamyl-peptidase